MLYENSTKAFPTIIRMIKHIQNKRHYQTDRDQFSDTPNNPKKNLVSVHHTTAIPSGKTLDPDNPRLIRKALSPSGASGPKLLDRASDGPHLDTHRLPLRVGGGVEPLQSGQPVLEPPGAFALLVRHGAQDQRQRCCHPTTRHRRVGGQLAAATTIARFRPSRDRRWPAPKQTRSHAVSGAATPNRRSTPRAVETPKMGRMPATPAPLPRTTTLTVSKTFRVAGCINFSYTRRIYDIYYLRLIYYYYETK